MEIKIKTVAEWLLEQTEKNSISDLLSQEFEGFPEAEISIYQIPSFRILAFVQGELVGHCAVDYRFISNEGIKYPTLGLIDFCVSSAFQDLHVGKRILQHVEKLGIDAQVDFIVLNTTNPYFYQKNGYQLMHNKCRWLLINNGQSIGVLRRSLNSSLAVKEISKIKWPMGEIDFLGHMV